MRPRSPPADADGPGRAAARHAACLDSGRVGDVRLRRGPRHRGRDRDESDARSDGAGARAGAPRGTRACQRRSRPAGDAGRQRRPGCARGPPSRRDKNLIVAYEFKLPDLGEGLTEGEIARWLVSEGQEIGEDDPLVEIQTDKTTVEIPSPAAGTVTSILVEEGKVVPVGTVLVVIGGDSGDGGPRVETERPAVSQPAPAAKGRATPLVRKIAQELGVDLDSLRGTGPQGRVTEEDVRAA